MPQIEIAKQAGACYGVERALKMVREAVVQAQGEGKAKAEVHTLGPLIHNPQVVAELEAQGVTVVDSPAQRPGSTLVMRTHGVTPQVEQAARDAGVHILDATCPYVKKAHLAAERLSREGYQVIIVGEEGHPEVEGTLGHAPEALVINDASEVEGVEVARRVGVVVQTTQTRACLEAVVGRLLGMADAMVVIGGRNSANTTHLAEICAAHCPQTHHIETADELDASWFAGAALIGITAGASTPGEQIESVRARIQGLVQGPADDSAGAK